MMATTHALVGVALAVLVGTVFPGSAAGTSMAPLVAAAVGGFFPDLDLYSGHRRTLHFPVYFNVAAAVAAVGAVVATAFVPSLGLAAASVALFLIAAGVHSAMDAVGGGLELKPWLAESDRAVYSHHHARWIRPRRWVRYDGAPEDLLVAAAVAAPVVYTVDGVIETGVLVAVGISVVYVLVRKPMVVVTQAAIDALPNRIVDRLPTRFVGDFR